MDRGTKEFEEKAGPPSAAGASAAAAAALASVANPAGFARRGVFWSAPGHIIASYDELMLQVRTGEMTHAALDSLEVAARLFRAQRRGKFGALSVLAATAPAAVGDVATRQQKLLTSILDDERMFGSAVIEGDGVGARLQRVLLRALLRNKRRGIHASVAEGVHWLNLALDGALDEPNVVAYIEGMRAQAKPAR